MTRIISICGKDGAGKTTVAINIALALRAAGNKVGLIDMDLSNAHMSLYLGINSHKTLNDFLKNKHRLEEIIHSHMGLKVIFSSLILDDLDGMDARDDMKSHIRKAFRHEDFVIMDSASGFGSDAAMSISAADEIVFAATPHIPAVVEAARCMEYVKILESRAKIRGILLNAVHGKKHELTKRDITGFAEAPIIGAIPYDDAVMESANVRKPLMLHKPKSRASKAFAGVAGRIAAGR